MRVSVLKTMTFESQFQLSGPRLKLSEVSLSFETKTETGKLLMVQTETRIAIIFKTETTGDHSLISDLRGQKGQPIGSDFLF